MDTNTLSKWASILGIPALIGWYITGYQTVATSLRASANSSLPSTFMGAFVLFGVIALVANALTHSKLSKLSAQRPSGTTRAAESPLVVLENGFLAWRDSRLAQVVGKQYLNDTVHLDNTTFLHCTFEHVTFVFEGTAPFNIIDSQLVRRNPNQPNFVLRSSNPIVMAALQLQVQVAQGTAGPITMRFEPGPP
jgi:hypothetical protein